MSNEQIRDRWDWTLCDLAKDSADQNLLLCFAPAYKDNVEASALDMLLAVITKNSHRTRLDPFDAVKSTV